MSAERIPQEDRLPARIEAFFLSNPSEYLTVQDVSIKMGCTVEQASKAIFGIKKRHGILKTETIVMLRGPDE